MDHRHKHDSAKRDFIKKALAVSSGLLVAPSASFLIGQDLRKGKFSKEAMFQEESARGVMCRICPNECVLKEGELSKCNNRIAHNSKLYTLAFGNPCSANIDPIEKKPLYHFLPGTRAFSIATAGCNLVCLNCQNWSISQTSPEKTRNFDMPPESVAAGCKKNSCPTIAYTYTEPITFYEYVFETATLARKAGIRNILKSNGYINPEPLKKLCGLVDAVNIDLKAFNESTYLKLTGGKLQPVLDSLKIYRDAGTWVEITSLVVPSWSDNPDEIRKMCRWLAENGFRDAPLHFSRFFPVHKLEQLPPTPVETLNRAAKIAAEEGIRYVYTGNVPGSELSDTACPSCKATLIKRQGYRILLNTIREGKCPECSRIVPGVWS
ncbi:MAG: AmmeMemoRadiSam system radical SAM enzyme [Bacteroidales bacterium]|nr:AmmeMemoRadiSam system radical SAM enzyme [Bacteroidales bacterium]MCU0408519.1 AmmeMemoRadiSam system radical SAM enzyme [Bacteroidales bacterium]